MAPQALNLALSGHRNATSTEQALTWHCRGGSTPSRTGRRSARRPGPRRPAPRSPAAGAGAPPWCGGPGPSCAPAPPSSPRVPALFSRVTNPRYPAKTRRTVANPRAGSHRGGAVGGEIWRTEGEVARVWTSKAGRDFSRYRLLLPLPSPSRRRV
jgi:hypothetical protein